MTNNVEPVYDDHGTFVGKLVNGDPKHSDSWRYFWIEMPTPTAPETV